MSPDGQKKPWYEIAKDLVRPIMGVSFSWALIYMSAIKGILDPLVIVGIAGTIIGYYFGERGTLKGVVASATNKLLGGKK